MNPLQQQQAQWDAEATPPPPPSNAICISLPAGWPYALLIGFTALYLVELLAAAWWRT